MLSVQVKRASQPLLGWSSRPPGKWTSVRRTHNTNAAQWIIHDPVGLPLEENCTARASVYCSSAPLKLPAWCYGKRQHVGVTVTSTQQGHCELQISCVFWVFGKPWQLLLFCLCGLNLSVASRNRPKMFSRCTYEAELAPFIILYLDKDTVWMDR